MLVTVGKTSYSMRPHRETVSFHSRTDLKRQVQILMETHGRFAHIRLGETSADVAISKEAGYLLGADIHALYPEPNVIFCEEWQDASGQNAAVLVVIRDGTPQLEAAVPPSSLAEDLLPFLHSEKKYSIYVVGNVPIANESTGEPSVVVIDQSRIKSFERLPTSVLARCAELPRAQLLAYDDALKAAGLRSNYAVIAGAVAMALGAAWWAMQPPPPPDKPIDPYAAYRSALQTPSPSSILNALADLDARGYNVPGWQAQRLVFRDGALAVTFKPAGGAVQSFAPFDRAGYRLTFEGTDAKLTAPVNLVPRMPPAKIMPARRAAYYAVDMVRPFGVSVQHNTGTNAGVYEQYPITLQLNGATAGVLTRVAAVLQELPAVLESADLTYDAHGSLNGSLVLSFYGTPL